jgi:CheY-like chemotaxis protein
MWRNCSHDGHSLFLRNRTPVREIRGLVRRHPSCNRSPNTHRTPAIKEGTMGKALSCGHWRFQVAKGEDMERPPRAIVAEDEPDVRMLVAVALRGLGYETVEASSGAELLDLLGDGLLEGDPQARPDIIISDIRMPGLTGLEILAGLRQAEWPTVIVLMTAYADVQIREEAWRLGADAFFAKPFDIDDLLTAVVNMTPPAPRGRKERRP